MNVAYQHPPRQGKDHMIVIVVVAVVGFFFMQFAPAIIMLVLSFFGAGVFLGYMWLFNPGEVHVLCPDDRTMRISADGGDPQVCLPDQFVTVDLDRGDHVVTIDDPTNSRAVEHHVTVRSGFFEVVAPASDDQCFVRMDVTQTLYPYMLLKGVAPPSPTIIDRYGSAEPFDIPGSTYVHADLLPTSVESGTIVYLVEAIPCSLVEDTDTEVLTHLGY